MQRFFFIESTQGRAGKHENSQIRIRPHGHVTDSDNDVQFWCVCSRPEAKNTKDQNVIVNSGTFPAWRMAADVFNVVSSYCDDCEID